VHRPRGKAKHFPFYQTPFDLLLRQLGVRDSILTGPLRFPVIDGANIVGPSVQFEIHLDSAIEVGEERAPKVDRGLPQQQRRDRRPARFLGARRRWWKSVQGKGA